jgi:hypothetical protein
MFGAAVAFTTDPVVFGMTVPTGTTAGAWAAWTVAGWSEAYSANGPSPADKYTTLTAIEPAGSGKYTFAATHGGSSTQEFRDAVDAILEGSTKRTLVDTLNRLSDALEAISATSGKYLILLDQDEAEIQVWITDNTPFAAFLGEEQEICSGDFTLDSTALPQAFE